MTEGRDLFRARLRHLREQLLQRGSVSASDAVEILELVAELAHEQEALGRRLAALEDREATP